MNTIKDYICGCCGEYHAELPRSYGCSYPVYYEYATPEERESDFVLNEDFCVMDNEHFFIRGCIEIPILGTNEQLIWGVWVSLSEANYKTVKENWNNQEVLEPMLGWFSSALPCYPDTVNLKAKVHHRSDGIRPYIELEPTDHPLAVELRNGVTIERVKQIAEALCANNKSNDSDSFETVNKQGKKYILSADMVKQLIDSDEGCIATNRITIDGCKVGFMYREEPYQDFNPDSGWRFMAGDEDQDYMDNSENSAVYQVNTICNYDSDITPYLDAPPGTAFIRDENGEFVVDEEWENPEGQNHSYNEVNYL